ncbi:hypothetical protein [Devosia sp. RR2S18]|uniref:hypothetical protein n=1 Tax=Devosia rhizosphaerae TaxID=3049774 RepID=UPI002541BCD8|nr:hypothetical protein [Devosia sp. RR2S18]WIJ23974.1 hypothetical protein QOV41_13120 [Devosia sp. RR2S18]
MVLNRSAFEQPHVGRLIHGPQADYQADHRLLDEHAPLIRKAFMESIADVRSQVTPASVVEA